MDQNISAEPEILNGIFIEDKSQKTDEGNSSIESKDQNEKVKTSRLGIPIGNLCCVHGFHLI